MCLWRLVACGLVALFATACTCKPHKMMDGSNALSNSANDNIGVADENGPLKDVHYGFDSYAVDATAKDILKGNAEWLKANPGRKVQVEGHCDERGTGEYNMVLGSNRARASLEYLRSLGIDSSRLSTISYGEDLPLDPAHNEQAWAKNRRAHFKVQ